MKLYTLGFLKKNNQTLMLHRTKKENDFNADKWIGIGGSMEKGESPEEGMVREFKEETGLDVKNIKLKGVFTYPADLEAKGKDGNKTMYVFLFLINEFNGDLIECNEGDLKWIDDDKVFDLNLWDSDRIFIKWLEEDGFHSAKFNYKKGVLIDYKLIKY